MYFDGLFVFSVLFITVMVDRCYCMDYMKILQLLTLGTQNNMSIYCTHCTHTDHMHARTHTCTSSLLRVNAFTVCLQPCQILRLIGQDLLFL